MAKKILGLDLGTTSIGWAYVIEADQPFETSSIINLGVRVNPLTVDEQTNFEKGKPVSVNADRTLKRGARRNLQRYKLRRDNLIKILVENNLITTSTIIAEDGKGTSHQIIKLRALATTTAINLGDIARVLLHLNKKRGYKSSRKAKNEEDGQAVDGMGIARMLYEENITPGQLCLNLLREGKKHLPDFYRSDLEMEFNKVWMFQKQFHSEILTDEFRKEIEGKGQRATSATFWNVYKFNTAENKGTREEKKIRAFEWRSKAIHTKLSKEEMAYVITEINNNINNSSGYLGAISDRSKELFFNKLTVGQYLFKQIEKNPHSRLKNQVFYRQDYLDEFETIWQTQCKFHPSLTNELKDEIRDVIIFYQRKLKSQKGLISFCEFESKKIEIEKDGKVVTKTVGLRVSPKSSPLFQEFKIWQNLNNLKIQNKATKEVSEFDLEAKGLLFEELNLKGNISKEKALQILGYQPKDWDLNFSSLEGNRTNQALITAYFKMIDLEGHDEIDWELQRPSEIKEIIIKFFAAQSIDISILSFDAEKQGKDFEKQVAFKLWHLLYSYEGDDSISGNEKLYQLLQEKFGFKREFGIILGNITMQDDYGSLSAKAMRKIIPYLKAGHPFAKKDEEDKIASATALAGYNHSSSLTKIENEKRLLKDKLEILPKNSLRNPVVEKILNQMINVINAIIANPEMGKPDEIRIELARELKKNAKERAEMTTNIEASKRAHEKITDILIKEFGIKNPTRNDIIRYKLYEELKVNGYKTLYSNSYIPREKLFSKEFDIEHIIPKALLFDDSFSNKTICIRQENLDKGDRTAFDYMENLGKEQLDTFVSRVEAAASAKEDSITKAKYKKLLMKASEIGEGFIERDLRESQYIAKMAKEMLQEICRSIISTSGSITDRLREDWGLINIMQELNFEKYKKLGLTEIIEKKDGSTKERITDWSKRNDHRHHAMDALTIAFTKHNHIQYLNYLNARRNERHKMHGNVMAIEAKETELKIDEDGKRKRKFKMPMTHFRSEAMHHLEQVLVSFKAKNKVATKNKNRIITGKGEKIKIELTPRGQLHKETVYGSLQQYAAKEEKIGPKFTEELINKVASPKYKAALLKRLKENENDPKKAFSGKNSPEKNPIIIDNSNTQKVPEKVKLVTLETAYTTRKEITPELKVEKVIDIGIRKILEARLATCNGNAKEAFVNLDKNPIWLNKEKGISIKRVTISGVNNVEPLHYKKDHLGNLILNSEGKPFPNDFVSTGNNHHVAIYKDEQGNLQESIVSFYEAIERINQGQPIINKLFNIELGWQFMFTMKQNEIFIFPNDGFYPAEIDLINPLNRSLISPNIFRVQKITTKDYFFRHHLETNVEMNTTTKNIAWKREGLKGIESIVKVRINHLGLITKIGEY